MSGGVTLSKVAQIIEAVLFLENDALTIERLSKLTDHTELVVSNALDELIHYYQQSSHGIELVNRSQYYQFLPKEHLWPHLKDHYGRKIDKRLSKAALETLSIIAYSQPITKKEIESIRGVSSETILRILREKDLIKVTGYMDGPGRPKLYGTTRKFLKNFNLTSISSLPKLNEIDEERFNE